MRRTFLEKLRGRWRLWWGFCPSCNSDAPELDTCKICNGFRAIDGPYPIHPPLPETLAEWRSKYFHEN